VQKLLRQIRACQVCQAHLPAGVRPVVQASPDSRILLIGQAPGRRVHETGIPWNDPSGDALRSWLGVDAEVFYDERWFALMPMGFCYPGKGPSGDLPPRPECAPLWHQPLLAQMPHIELVVLIGQYAQKAYLKDRHRNLTERVRDFQQYLPQQCPIPHPSPRNRHWQRNNPWFTAQVVPALQSRVKQVLSLPDSA